MRGNRRTARADGRTAVAALFGKTRRGLLAWLFRHPRKAFYLRQLARIVGGSTGNVPRELARLESAGIVRRTRKGREVFFQVNPDSPAYAGLRLLFRERG